jgi:hypothetical protein
MAGPLVPGLDPVIKSGHLLWITGSSRDGNNRSYSHPFWRKYKTGTSADSAMMPSASG